MESCWTKLIDAVKREKSKDESESDGDLEVGENVGYWDDEFVVDPTPALKGLDVLNWPKISSSSPSSTCQIAFKEILIRFPEDSVTNETQLQFPHFHLLNFFVLNCGGDTVLHLASSTKKLPTLELLVEDSEMLNAKNNGRFTVLAEEDEIEKNLGRAGGKRSRDIHPILEHKHKPKHQFIKQNKDNRSEFSSDRYHALLLIATLLAAMTFHAALRSPAIFSQNQSTPLVPLHIYDSHQINHLFILFNSVAFFASLALITLLTHQFPMNLWLLIVLFSTIGAYICAIMVVSPNEVSTVIFVGNFIWFAALFKYLALDQIVARQVHWIFTRIRVI